jgi:hypothetical protein
MIYLVFKNKYILVDCDLLNWMFSNFTEAFYRTSCPHIYIRISVKTFQFKVIVMHFLMLQTFQLYVLSPFLLFSVVAFTVVMKG